MEAMAVLTIPQGGLGAAELLPNTVAVAAEGIQGVVVAEYRLALVETCK